MTTTTIADRILINLLGNDGRKRTTRLGVNRYALVNRIARVKHRDRFGNVTGWMFVDGSEIEDCGGGWDTPEGWAANT